ncbi:hypothetical protein EDD85DRAFT_797929 [Armillaria nabsnona]|nr:hypothetical protein EDD85DRAFT_797929 [Armillaria nabsnona]
MGVGRKREKAWEMALLSICTCQIAKSAKSMDLADFRKIGPFQYIEAKEDNEADEDPEDDDENDFQEFIDDSEQTTQEGLTDVSHHSGESKDGDEVEQYVKEVTEHACKRRRIEQESHKKMLEDNSASCSLWCVRCKRPPAQPGDWVIIKSGPYRRDMGCILNIQDWGLDVLVVLRIILFNFIHTRKQNRSHTKPGLWSTETLYHFRSCQETQGITNPCWNEKNEIEHGLLVLKCHHDAIASATTALLSILDLFHQSGHPAILAAEYRAPCPHEWSFEKDEQVEILCQDDQTHHGRVIAMSTHGVEVDLNDGVGVHLYPFYDIVKFFTIGDYEFNCSKNSMQKSDPPKKGNSLSNSSNWIVWNTGLQHDPGDFLTFDIFKLLEFKCLFWTSVVIDFILYLPSALLGPAPTFWSKILWWSRMFSEQDQNDQSLPRWMNYVWLMDKRDHLYLGQNHSICEKGHWPSILKENITATIIFAGLGVILYDWFQKWTFA